MNSRQHLFLSFSTVDPTLVLSHPNNWEAFYCSQVLVYVIRVLLVWDNLMLVERQRVTALNITRIFNTRVRTDARRVGHMSVKGVRLTIIIHLRTDQPATLNSLFFNSPTLAIGCPLSKSILMQEVDWQSFDRKKLTLVGRAGNTRFACHGIEAFQEGGVCSDSHILPELFQNRLGH